MIDLLPNFSLVYQWVIFMIAVFTLHYGIFRPVLKIINERKKRTVGESDMAHELEAKSVELAAVLNKKMEEARLKGIEKKEELKSHAEKIIDGLLKKTRAELEKKMEEARRSIEMEYKEASLQLAGRSGELGHQVASKILERQV